MNAHDLTIEANDGRPLAFRDFAGKAVLVVNTASECGYTPQYRGLQSLWDRYRQRGLVVLGVPSNDFGAQEPGSDAEIRAFCDRTYKITFPMAKKQVVIGAGAHAFYRWVASEIGEDAVSRWNFHKYLVDGRGDLAGAWPSRVEPEDPAIIQSIEAALAG
ncbi:MAG: glutathione peroxidase [Alphaproteobacteria bacterium]